VDVFLRTLEWSGSVRETHVRMLRRVSCASEVTVGISYDSYSTVQTRLDLLFLFLSFLVTGEWVHLEPLADSCFSFSLPGYEAAQITHTSVYTHTLPILSRTVQQ
jgi:hypothetical protein